MSRQHSVDAWDALDLEVPVIQAPIGSATTAALAAAVSESGALGSLALTWHSPAAAADCVRQVRAASDKPLAVNLVLEWDATRHVHACIEAGARIFSFFWGDLSPYIDRIHSADGIVMHTVGSVDEGRRAADAGVDVIVAQGYEAGGHVRGRISTLVWCRPW